MSICYIGGKSIISVPNSNYHIDIFSKQWELAKIKAWVAKWSIYFIWVQPH